MKNIIEINDITALELDYADNFKSLGTTTFTFN